MSRAKKVTERTWTKTVRGLIYGRGGAAMGTTNIDVLLSVDKSGATLSLAAGQHVMLSIPLEAVSDMIAPVKKEGQQ